MPLRREKSYGFILKRFTVGPVLAVLLAGEKGAFAGFPAIIVLVVAVSGLAAFLLGGDLFLFSVRFFAHFRCRLLTYLMPEKVLLALRPQTGHLEPFLRFPCSLGHSYSYTALYGITDHFLFESLAGQGGFSYEQGPLAPANSPSALNNLTFRSFQMPHYLKSLGE